MTFSTPKLLFSMIDHALFESASWRLSFALRASIVALMYLSCTSAGWCLYMSPADESTNLNPSVHYDEVGLTFYI
jgi:hypothetical protein